MSPPLAAAARALPAGPKLSLLAAASVGVFLLAAPWQAAAVLVAAVGLAWAAGTLASLRALRPLALVLALTIAAHALAGDWELGLVVALRLAALVILADMVSATTALSAMLAAFDTLLAPVRRLGVPTRPVAVALTMTLRFAPMLAGRWQGLAQAWRARSTRRPGWRLMVPFILGVLDDADRAAEALTARGGFSSR